MADVNDWNTQIIKEFRENDGKVGGQFEGAPMVLVTTIGAKSGKRRTTPLMSLPDADRLAIFASKAGAPTNPDWYHNVRANPAVTVEFGTETFDATATIAEGAERDRLFSKQAELYSGFAEYEAKTDRVIPVVILERVASGFALRVGTSSAADKGRDDEREHRCTEDPPPRVHAADQLIARPEGDRSGDDDIQRGTDGAGRLDNAPRDPGDAKDDDRRVRSLPDRDLTGLTVSEQPIEHTTDPRARWPAKRE